MLLHASKILAGLQVCSTLLQIQVCSNVLDWSVNSCQAHLLNAMAICQYDILVDELLRVLVIQLASGYNHLVDIITVCEVHTQDLISLKDLLAWEGQFPYLTFRFPDFHHRTH
jgi:hypothetical protein